MKEYSKFDLFLYVKFLEETGSKNNQTSIKEFKDNWLLSRKRKGVDWLNKLFDEDNDSTNPLH